MPTPPTHVLAPYLVVKGGFEAMAFYTKVFEFKELFRLVDPNDGRLGHAELQKGHAIFMLADEYPDMGNVSPRTLGGSPVLLHVYVEDVDATVDRAVAAGAKLVRPVADQFYGDRSGGIEDPFGHQWYFATQKEIVSMEELERRAKEKG